MALLPAEIQPAMQGIIPAVLSTCSLNGLPNIAMVSQIFPVDEEHIAISFQFFNKTIKNVRENPHAFVQLLDPETMESWSLEIQYDHSETSGKIFEQMDMQLEAIASMSGMSGIFKLKAADIYKVKSVSKNFEEWLSGK